MKSANCIILTLLTFVWSACEDKGTESIFTELQLSVADVGVTDASLHLKVTTIVPIRAEIALTRNDSLVLALSTSFPLDTVLMDQDLLPRTNYKYLVKLSSSSIIEQSEPVVLTTMESLNITKHNHLLM